MGLDYWDKPEYPACTDVDCTAARAGIHHLMTDSHRELLDHVRLVRGTGGSEPRNLFLKAALKQRARQERRWQTLVVWLWTIAMVCLFAAIFIAVG